VRRDVRRHAGRALRDRANARALAHGASLVVIGRPRTPELFALAGADELTVVEDRSELEG
jgi:hypothetical protein